MTGPVCTCEPPAYWGTCNYCEQDRWVRHRCDFPCDDVTCEDGAICPRCLTGVECPLHDAEYEL